MINFSVSETTGRTFELDESKINELYAQCYEPKETDDIETKLTHIICELGFEVLEEYEKNNDYCELDIVEVNEV